MVQTYQTLVVAPCRRASGGWGAWDQMVGISSIDARALLPLPNYLTPRVLFSLGKFAYLLVFRSSSVLALSLQSSRYPVAAS